MIPSPIPDSFPYKLQGQVYTIGIGNELQIKSERHMSYVVMQGVNNPDAEVELENGAIAKLQELTGDSELEVIVYARDRLQRSIGQVFVGERNINLEMIRSGWGQYDGADFEMAHEFQRAEEQAKGEGLGIWAHNR